jgi:hypothetical protein
MDRPESSVAPDVMFECPACGVVPAVFKIRAKGAYCDHCQSLVSLESITRVNPGVVFPHFPEVDTYIEGGHYVGKT